MENLIHPLSVIHPNAQLGKNVKVDPFVTIHDDVIIGNDTWIGSNAVIFPGARIGENCKIYPGAIISGVPQDLKFHNEYSTTEIGNNTTIREYVTIHRGTEYSNKTVVKNNVMLMAYVHVAHDCVIGNNVIISNAVNMAGHVEIDDFAVIGGMTAIHQFCKVGKFAMVSGGSLVRKDVPPFVKAGREPLSYEGINFIGLKRRNFSPEQTLLIQNMYRILFLSDLNTSNAINQILDSYEDSDLRNEIVDFITSSSRGVIKGFSSKNDVPED